MLRKKILAVAVSALIACTVVACGSNNSSNQEEQPTKTPVVSKEEGTASPSKQDKPATVSMMTLSAELTNDSPVLKWIQDATNVAVEVSHAAGDYNEGLALVMAGGDLPDIVVINDVSQANSYGSQGALLDFNEHLDRMPNLKAFWDKYPDLKRRATTPDGKIYIAINEGLGYSNQMVWMYRPDVLEKHNLQVPTTWDELHIVLQSLKKEYPDSYPLIFRFGLESVELTMAPSFGTYYKVYPDLQTGEVKFAPVTENFRHLLENLNTFYKEKLINTDFLSITTDQWVEMMTTGKSFFTVDYIGRIQSLSEAMMEEGAELRMMPPPAGPNSTGYNPFTNYMTGGFTVAKNSKNLEAALHYIDFLYSEAGTELVSWGIEGETFTVKDGRKVLTAAKDHLELAKVTGQTAFGVYGLLDEKAPQSFISEKFKVSYDEAPKYQYPTNVVPPNFKNEELETISIVYEQIIKHKDTNEAKFIIGERPFSEWDAYVQEVQNLGLQQVLDLYKLGWDRQK